MEQPHGGKYMDCYLHKDQKVSLLGFVQQYLAITKIRPAHRAGLVSMRCERFRSVN